MQFRKYSNSLCKVIALTLILAISACATQYVADSDADQLVAAMQDLPEVQPYLAIIKFRPELNDPVGKTNATSVDSRNLKKIIYPELEMLNLAGHASIFRWFSNDGESEDAPVLNIHARVYKMEHSIKVNSGRMQPIAKTKLEVFITDAKNNRIYESFFATKAEGKQDKVFRDKRATQDMYGYTIYKALTLAFEAAFEDIVYTLGLTPSSFDIDNINPQDINIVEEIEKSDNTNMLEVTENNRS